MPYDELLATRVRETLGHRSALVEKQLAEKNMFGGVCFLLNGNICVGIWKEFLIVRTGADAHDETLSQPHTQEFDITGRTMRGWAMIQPTGTARDESLQAWINRALQFVKTLPAK